METIQNNQINDITSVDLIYSFIVNSNKFSNNCTVENKKKSAGHVKPVGSPIDPAVSELLKEFVSFWHRI